MHIYLGCRGKIEGSFPLVFEGKPTGEENSFQTGEIISSYRCQVGNMKHGCALMHAAPDTNIIIFFNPSRRRVRMFGLDGQ